MNNYMKTIIRKIKAAWAAFIHFLKVLWFWTKVSTAAVAVASLLIFVGFTIASSRNAGAAGTIFVKGSASSNQIKAALYKGELLQIIRKHETTNRVIKEGEIFSSFDPNSKMRASCMVTGGKRPIDCESYGIYQEKIGTVMAYAPQLYGHEVTQIEAMTIANDEEKASDFLLQCAVKIQGCIWNWTSANNNHAVVEDLINKIRDLEK